MNKRIKKKKAKKECLKIIKMIEDEINNRDQNHEIRRKHIFKPKFEFLSPEPITEVKIEIKNVHD